MIPFQELKPALFNWEDLHIDQISGFEPEGSTFYFGEIGANHVASPYMSIIPGENKPSLYITYTEFVLFELAITWLTKEAFDEYGEYEFSADQWKAIMDESERILDYASFDDLFDYLTDYDICFASGVNVFRALLNSNGVKLWTHKEQYRTQLKDMREWTKLVLSDNDSITIYGF